MALNNGNSVLVFNGCTIGLFIAKLVKDGTEHRMWPDAYGWLCVLYRDPAGNYIALAEEFTHTGVRVAMYRACQTGWENPLKPRSLEPVRARFAAVEAEDRACVVCGGVDEGNTCCPGESFDEPKTALMPRVSTREILATDPDGHYARANGLR